MNLRLFNVTHNLGRDRQIIVNKIYLVQCKTLCSLFIEGIMAMK